MEDVVEAKVVFLSQARRRIHAELQREGMLDVDELSARLRLPRATTADHLAKMEAAGAVQPHPAAGAGGGVRYTALDAGPSLALANLILQSVPARELVQHLVDHPGQHLGQAAQALGAPRSRYWRVLETLVARDLLTLQRNARQILLFPTPLAKAAVESLRPEEMHDMIRSRSRRSSSRATRPAVQPPSIQPPSVQSSPSEPELA